MDVDEDRSLDASAVLDFPAINAVDEMQDFDSWDDETETEAEENRLRQMSMHQSRTSSASVSRSVHFNDQIDVSDFRNCLICWEEQYFRSSNDSSNGGNASGMASSIAHFNNEVFRLEASLRGHFNNELVLQSMIRLRRTLVEQPLEKQGVRYTPWTMEMLRKHYHPHSGHRFDPERDMKWELEMLAEMQRKIYNTGIVRTNPDGEEAVDRAAVDAIVKVSMRRSQLHKQVASLQKQTANMQESSARQLMLTVRRATRTDDDPAESTEAGNNAETDFLDTFEISGF